MANEHIRVSRMEDHLEAQIAGHAQISDVIGELQQIQETELPEGVEDKGNLVATYMYLNRDDGIDRPTFKPVFDPDSKAIQEPPHTKRGYRVVIRYRKSRAIVMQLLSTPSAPRLAIDGSLKVYYPQVGQLIDMLSAIGKVCC